MSTPLRTFECTDGVGWSWICTLIPHELVMDGRRQHERQFQRFRLRYCDDYAERGNAYSGLPPPARFWVIWLSTAVVVFTILALLAFIVGKYLLPGSNAVPGCLLFVGLYGNVPIGIFLVGKFRRRRIHRWVTFRDIRDGSAYFTIACGSDEPTDDVELIQFTRHVQAWKTDPTSKPTDEFEQFIFEVVAAIKRIREAEGRDDPGSAPTFTTKPT